MTTSLYYKNPEGEDYFGKLYYALTRSAVAAGVISTADLTVYSRPKGFLPTLARIHYISWPIVTMSVAFVTGTYIATNLRKKDDMLNYIIGGISAGVIGGVWSKRVGSGALACASCALIAGIKKHSVDNNWRLVPDAQRQERTLGSKNFDFTLTAELPGNWTTGRN